MSERISDEQLNDYVDGLLSEAEAAEVERLMASSAAARDTVAFLRSLRAATADLPASIEPQRDLWPQIEGRMAPAPLAVVDEEASVAPRASAASWWPQLNATQWATLATAAMLLVVSSSAITAWMVGGDAPLPAEAVPTEVVSLAESAEPLPVEARYAAEIEGLMWSLYENRDSLDPETVSTIETNMRVIDRAIRRAREALEEDPANAGLSRMLDTNYRHKLQLLQRANRIIEMS